MCGREYSRAARNVRGRASGLLNDYKYNEGKELMQSYFPMQNLLKMLPSTSSVVI